MNRILALCLTLLSALAARADMAAVLPVPDDPAAALSVPAGFRIGVYARLTPGGGEFFRGPRFMAFGPDGHLYLSLGFDNKVVMLPDRNRDGRADEVVTVADRLNAPQGLAFVDGRLYVANQDGVVRLEQKEGRWPAAAVTPVISGLPAGGHTLKSLKLGPDGFLYLNVGSSCNVCREEDPLRATLLRYTVQGKPAGGFEFESPVLAREYAPVWATGLRNSQGFAWHPQTGAMYATNNGADKRSDRKGGAPVDDLPPEHLNRIEPGRDYGWPYCWGDHVPDPNFSPGYPDPATVCRNAAAPAITFPAHSTPIGITFLADAAFPEEYRSDALVALHGSWNRRQPDGYRLERVHFAQGRPVKTSNFVTGWLSEKGAWGRPVDVLAGPDGAVYVSDDRAGMVYRISHDKKNRE